MACQRSTFYANLMADLDVHMVRSTVTASGTTVGLAGLYHRQLHGTGQGAVEGPVNWIPIADILVIAVVRRRSKQPVALPMGDGKMYMFYKAWCVGDSGLGQAGEGSTRALQHVTNGSGLMYYFLRLERRGFKVPLVQAQVDSWRAGASRSRCRRAAAGSVLVGVLARARRAHYRAGGEGDQGIRP